MTIQVNCESSLLQPIGLFVFLLDKRQIAAMVSNTAAKEEVEWSSTKNDKV